MRARLFSTVAVTVTLALTGTVAAQTRNTPYSPGTASPGAGFSLGYRQAILNAQVFGQRPRALVKGPNGELLGIQQSGRNALVFNPDDGSFTPGARPNASWPTGLGKGLGWNLAPFSSGGSGFASAASQSLNSWILQVPSGPNGNTSNFGQYNDGSTPIDAWIIQLDQI